MFLPTGLDEDQLADCPPLDSYYTIQDSTSGTVKHLLESDVHSFYRLILARLAYETF